MHIYCKTINKMLMKSKQTMKFNALAENILSSLFLLNINENPWKTTTTKVYEHKNTDTGLGGAIVCLSQPKMSYRQAIILIQ